MAKNISEKLLAYMAQQREQSGAKGSLEYYKNNFVELGFSSELVAEMAWHHEQANPQQSQPTRNDAVEKDPYSSAISAKKAARSKQGVDSGANAFNTDTRRKE